MGIENRRYQRLDIAIEVRVQGEDQSGQPFQESTLSGNISASGCSLLLSYDLAAGTELELEFLRHLHGQAAPLSIPLRGSVVRSMPLNAAQNITGIQFLNGLFPMDALL